ncbi:anthrone oxygenase family protein [Streptomyces sp. NBC_00343]|uniref:anthrone oxygenase family protein n=1 Tax=Streptomyces sp. NBC_00343 TaxID=2975719 RepID=UPI002E2B793C|nr:anthrone oxygenase family protein [Streptomyces sp. NBC_00343]
MTEKQGTSGTGWVLGAATVAMGLIAGVFYVFACAIMPALARSDDRVFVEVMRNINDVIQNPVFFLSFMGALVLAGVSAWQARGRPYRGWVWAGLIAYALAFLVTVAFNIPLNDGLADTADAGVARERFESAWVGWNVVRAVLSTVGVGCLVRGLVLYGGFRRRVASQRGAARSSPSGV